MSTRAAIILPNSDGTCTTIYCHFDGQPSRMLPALAAHQPEAIREAREIRFMSETEIEGYAKPRTFPTTARPVFPEWACHAYLLTPDGWKHAKNQTELTAHHITSQKPVELPEMAYAQNPSNDRQIILIKRGETGYWPYAEMATAEQAEGFVRRRNERLGVTPEQAEILLTGSVFGFDTPAIQEAMKTGHL